jgi:hypothetical protein
MVHVLYLINVSGRTRTENKWYNNINLIIQIPGIKLYNYNVTSELSMGKKETINDENDGY